MSERDEKEKLKEEQKGIFNNYLRSVGISPDDEHAQRILVQINAGKITTFREEQVMRTDKAPQKITIAEMNDGYLRKPMSGVRNLLDIFKEHDRTLFNDMVALGFTLSVYSLNNEANYGFNGAWRGDGLPKTE